MKIRTARTVGVVEAMVWKMQGAGLAVELRFRALEPVLSALGQEKLSSISLTDALTLARYAFRAFRLFVAKFQAIYHCLGRASSDFTY